MGPLFNEWDMSWHGTFPPAAEGLSRNPCDPKDETRAPVVSEIFGRRPRIGRGSTAATGVCRFSLGRVAESPDWRSSVTNSDRLAGRRQHRRAGFGGICAIFGANSHDMRERGGLLSWA